MERKSFPLKVSVSLVKVFRGLAPTSSMYSSGISFTKREEVLLYPIQNYNHKNLIKTSVSLHV